MIGFQIFITFKTIFERAETLHGSSTAVIMKQYVGVHYPAASKHSPLPAADLTLNSTQLNRKITRRVYQMKPPFVDAFQYRLL